MVETPVKLPSTVAVVPCRIGTSSLTLMRTCTNCGSFSHRFMSSTLPTGTPAKVTWLPSARPSTDCGKKMSYCLRSLVPQPAIQMMNTDSAASSTRVTIPTQT